MTKPDSDVPEQVDVAAVLNALDTEHLDLLDQLGPPCESPRIIYPRFDTEDPSE